MHWSHVFFDLDGTLTDSAEGILNSVAYALAHFDLSFSRKELLPFIGPPLRHSFAPLLGYDMLQVEVAVSKYREYFSNRGIFENRLYPGITEMLRACTQAGLVLCLATSKPEPFAIRILEHFEISHFFSVIAGAELHGPRNEKVDVLRYAYALAGQPSFDSCLMVGDRKYDVQGAHAVGMSCCAVLFGYGSHEELHEAGAEIICSSTEELQRLLLQI